MKRLRLVATAGGLVLLLLFVFTGYQALRAKTSLQTVANSLDGVGLQLRQGNAAAARGQLDAARESARTAHRNTVGPGWWLGSHLPLVGDDVRAVRTVSGVADSLTNGVIPRMLDAGDALAPAKLRPRDGRVRLDGVARATPALVAGDKQFQRQADRVKGIRTSRLGSVLAGPVAKLKVRLDRAAAISSAVSAAARLMPSMLGAGQARRYLLMFQNNAEARATGGIGGSFALVNTAKGKAKMGEQGSFALVGRQKKSVLPLTSEEQRLFREDLGRYPQDVNFTPDFPRTGQLLAAMWAKRHPPVDGVVSADPVALSYLLAGTGPVKMPRGTELTAANVVYLLLNGTYLQFPLDFNAQDAFFQEAAKAVFDAVAAGQGNPGVVLDGLVRGVLERRLILWSSHASEQSLLDRTEIAGSLDAPEKNTPQIGVYLNDGTGAKLDFYLDAVTSVRSLSCDSGRQAFDVKMAMRSSAPSNAAKALPLSILGLGNGAAIGSIRTTVYLYAPEGGALSDVTLDSKKAPAGLSTHRGHPVAALTLDLAPGETRQITARMHSARGQDGDVQLRTTPGVRTTGAGTVEPSRCAH